MVFSTEHQLELPNNFPSNEMVAFMASARQVLLNPTMSEAWKEFGGASNLIGWRFRSCYEDMTQYIESWKKYGPGISFEEMYTRERALFGMFTAGVSCIESTCYALNALVSHPNILDMQFGEDEQRSCSPVRLKKCLSKYPKALALSNVLKTLTISEEWALWVDLRNRMTHRSNLPCINFMGTDPLPPSKALHFATTSSTPSIEIDVLHLENMFTWLADSLRQLLLEGNKVSKLTNTKPL